jgi:hypothetical protein
VACAAPLLALIARFADELRFKPNLRAARLDRRDGLPVDGLAQREIVRIMCVGLPAMALAIGQYEMRHDDSPQWVVLKGRRGAAAWKADTPDNE